MNWAAISFDWNQIRAFLATVEEGSLSAAARALGQTQPTLSRQITALEESLNVVLFERGRRSMSLTQPGRDLLEHVQAMGEAANRISLVASGQSQLVEGEVSITATDLFSTYLMPEFLHRLRASAPAIRVELVVSNEVRNLLRREADIALRHVRPEQPDLITRRLPNSTAYLFAASSLLEMHGVPQTGEALANLPFVGTKDNSQAIAELNGRGIPITADNFRYVADSAVTVWRMAKEGLGVCLMPMVLGARTSQMEVLFAESGPIEFPTWLTTHRELHSSKRIRLVFDLLADYFVEISRTR